MSVTCVTMEAHVDARGSGRPPEALLMSMGTRELVLTLRGSSRAVSMVLWAWEKWVCPSPVEQAPSLSIVVQAALWTQKI